MASDRIAQQRAADAADDQTGGPIGMAAIATPVAALIFTRLILVSACLPLRGRAHHGGRTRDGRSPDREDDGTHIIFSHEVRHALTPSA